MTSRRRDSDASRAPAAADVAVLRELTGMHGKIRDAADRGRGGKVARLWEVADRLAAQALPAYLDDQSDVVRCHAERVADAHVRLASLLHLTVRPPSS